jgi:hypothetical protein
MSWNEIGKALAPIAPLFSSVLSGPEGPEGKAAAALLTSSKSAVRNKDGSPLPWRGGGLIKCEDKQGDT